MTKKSFTFGDDIANPDPPEFDLVGKDAQGNPAGPFVFHCIGHLNETVMSRTLGKIEENPILGISDIVDFIAQCLIDEEVQAFRDLIARKDVNIDSVLLGNVMMFLVEDYAKRPTRASSVYSDGPMPTGVTSTGAVGGTPGQAPSV